jgi:hypothetical protein
VSSTRFLAPAVSLPTQSSIHFSFSSLLKKCVSHLFSPASFILDLKLCNARRARTLSTCKPLIPSFAWWRRWVDHFVDVPHLSGGGGKTFCFRALTIVACVDFVVERDVRCCKLGTIWRQAVSFMSRLVRLLILNKAKSPSCLSLNEE